MVGVWQDRAGTDWVIDYLKEQRKTFASVVVRSGAASPVGALLTEMQKARLPITEWKGTEISAAHGQIFDRLRDGMIAHLPRRPRHRGHVSHRANPARRRLGGGHQQIAHRYRTSTGRDRRRVGIGKPTSDAARTRLEHGQSQPMGEAGT